MAHESFEDEQTAKVMNELFVNIKVDREERPDIDQIYMNALHLLGEQGGWPLTMFLTPATEPVWGGTYFPKEVEIRPPGLHRHFAAKWRGCSAKSPTRSSRTAWRCWRGSPTKPGRPARSPSGCASSTARAQQVGNMFDPVNGGLRGAPKFPQPSLMEMLWRAGVRTGDARFFQTVEHSLERMSEGGIYDHLGGGFSRYSVDERWLVPHFEKMLYDNAQLLELLALASQRGGNPVLHQRAQETVGWLQREMTVQDGAFAASLDADSEGEEGKFYVWSKAEIDEVLGEENAALFAAHYDVSAGGNFEGHNILNRLNRLTAQHGNRGPARHAALHAAQKARKPYPPGPRRQGAGRLERPDDCRFGQCRHRFGRAGWLHVAQQAFDFIANNMTQGDRLGHSWRAGQLLFPGLASDYAAMIRAALALYEATAERAYLERALSWQRAFDAHYADPDTGGYFLSADDAADLLLRPHSTLDDATPNPNALAAQNLVRLAVLAGDERWRAQADRLIEGILSAAERNLFGHVALLNALDLRLRAAEIVCTGPDAETFARAALKLPFLDRIVLRAASAADLAAAHPAQEKLKSTAGSAAFICVGERCSLPVTDAGAIAEAVAAMAALISPQKR